MAENAQGEIKSQRWWITTLESEAILYEGEGGVVDAVLEDMYTRGEEGKYIIYFKLEDPSGTTYTLTRQFAIQIN